MYTVFYVICIHWIYDIGKSNIIILLSGGISNQVPAVTKDRIAVTKVTFTLYAKYYYNLKHKELVGFAFTILISAFSLPCSALFMVKIFTVRFHETFVTSPFTYLTEMFFGGIPSWVCIVRFVIDARELVLQIWRVESMFFGMYKPIHI